MKEINNSFSFHGMVQLRDRIGLGVEGKKERKLNVYLRMVQFSQKIDKDIWAQTFWTHDNPTYTSSQLCEIILLAIES